MTQDRCPQCNARLPRRLRFTRVEDGADLLFAGISFAAGTMAMAFALIHAVIWPDTPPDRLAAGAALYGILWTEAGLCTTLFRFYWDRRQHMHGFDAPLTMEATGPALLSLGNRHLRLPSTWTEHDARVYLCAVRDEFAAFSQDGMRGKLPERPREDFNALLEWCVRGGFYECRNGGTDNRNGGTWLEDGRGMTLLDKLKETINERDRT